MKNFSFPFNYDLSDHSILVSIVVWVVICGFPELVGHHSMSFRLLNSSSNLAIFRVDGYPFLCDLVFLSCSFQYPFSVHLELWQLYDIGSFFSETIWVFGFCSLFVYLINWFICFFHLSGHLFPWISELFFYESLKNIFCSFKFYFFSFIYITFLYAYTFGYNSFLGEM